VLDIARARRAVKVEFTLCEMSMNVVHVVRRAAKGALVAWTSANGRRLLVRLLRDEAGTNLVLFAFLMPVLVGIAGLATEGGLWLSTQQALQGAADSAAISAAWGYLPSLPATNIQTQAEAVTATYGFVNGVNGVTVVAAPTTLTSGNYTAANGYTCSPYPCAIEVTVTKKVSPLFSSLWFSKPFNISAFGVAIPPTPQCILALGTNNPSGAVTVAVLAAINLTGCGLFADSDSSSSIAVDFFAAIVATDGSVGTVGNVQDFFGVISPAATTGDPLIPDPYAKDATPTPGTTPSTYTPPAPGTCIQLGTKSGSTYTITTSTTLTAGKTYCAVTVGNKGVLTANAAGTYIFTGQLTVASGGQVAFTSGASSTYVDTDNTKSFINVQSGGQVTFNAGTYVLYAKQGTIFTDSGTVTLNSGTYGLYGGISVPGGTLTSSSGTTMTMSELAETNSAQVTLNGGTYIFNSSTTTTPMVSLTDSTLTGTGVTLVFTSNSGKYDATAMTVTASTINLTAPTTGPTTGIALFGNNSTSGSNAMPLGTNFTLDVDSTLKVSGAVYLPRGALKFAAFDFSSENCTQIIADTIDVIGIAYFGDQCTSFGTKSISSSVPMLVE
jgi:Flp pilus assembly protein TadG